MLNQLRMRLAPRWKKTNNASAKSPASMIKCSLYKKKLRQRSLVLAAKNLPRLRLPAPPAHLARKTLTRQSLRLLNLHLRRLKPRRKQRKNQKQPLKHRQAAMPRLLNLLRQRPPRRAPRSRRHRLPCRITPPTQLLLGKESHRLKPQKPAATSPARCLLRPVTREAA